MTYRKPKLSRMKMTLFNSGIRIWMIDSKEAYVAPTPGAALEMKQQVEKGDYQVSKEGFWVVE